MKRQAFGVLLLLACCAWAFAEDAPQGRVKRYEASRATIVVVFPGSAEVHPRDVYLVTHQDKKLGECMVTEVHGTEARMLPKASFKGQAGAGDVATFVRRADVPVETGPPWITFKDPGGAFTAQFPRDPRREEQSQQGNYGPVRGVTFAAVSTDGRREAYELDVIDYTTTHKFDEHERLGDSDFQLDHHVTQLAERFHLGAVTAERCELNGFPGRQFEGVSAQDHVRLRCRLIWVEQRLYALTAAVADKHSLSSDASRFLSSLQIKKKASL